MTKSGVPNSLRLGSTLGEMAMLPLLLTQLTGYGLYDLPQTQDDLSVRSKNSLGCWSIRRFIFKFKTILKDLTTGDWTQMGCLVRISAMILPLVSVSTFSGRATTDEPSSSLIA